VASKNPKRISSFVDNEGGRHQSCRTRLSVPLSDVDVTDIAEGNASTITLETPGLEKQTLWLKELNAAKDYAAAIAMVGSEGAVNLCPL
jgi:hypothetical protein